MKRRERIDELRARHRELALERGIHPRDVDLLLADLLDRSTSWLFAHGEELVDPEPLELLLERRYSGEPLQYIRGRTEFYSREFLVDNRVLIPRPETELVVEAAIERAKPGARIIDLGTGSGCIAISIERERPDLQVFAIDRSVDALAVASKNRERLNSNVKLAASDLLTSVRGMFDIVVSNPPYVPLHEYKELAVEVRIHEPRIALTPGRYGTEIISRILTQVRPSLTPDGWVIIEVGYGQEEAIRRLAKRKKFNVEAFLDDLAGIPRVVVLSKHGQ